MPVSRNPGPRQGDGIENVTGLMIPSELRLQVAPWSHRLAWPRTEPSQGSDTGSNPVGTTTVSPHLARRLPLSSSWSLPRQFVHRTIHRTKVRSAGESRLHGAVDSIRVRRVSNG